MREKVKKAKTLSQLINAPRKGLYKLRDNQVTDDFNALVISESDGKVYEADLSNFAGEGVESIVAGAGVTVDDTDPANPIVSSTGTTYTEGAGIDITAGVISTELYIDVTFAELTTLISGSDLIPGAKYHITDFATIYDQSGSDVTKTAAGEDIVVTAISNSLLSPIASSLDFPTDIIYYDATVVTTYVNSAPCKGKITYREDEKGNSAFFDFRKILLYNVNTFAEALAFDVASAILHKVGTPSALPISLAGLEFAPHYIEGTATNNNNNFCIQAYFAGDFTKNDNNNFLGADITGNVSGNSGCDSSNLIVGGYMASNVKLEATDVTVTGNLDNNTNCIWNNTTFGENANKCTEVNFNNSSVADRVSRIVNSTILTTTLGGRLFWCENIELFTSEIDGDVNGLNSLTIVDSEANCILENIKGISQNSSTGSRFDTCTITGTDVSSIFGNIFLTAYVNGKTITELLYPELFDPSYCKTIYQKPNGTVWYTWLDNSNVAQFTEIV